MEFLSGAHPFVIHFPIALLVLYLLLEISAVVFKKDFLFSASFIILLIGVAFALLAALTGNQAFEQAKLILKDRPKEILEAIEEHEQFATITLWYFSGLVILRVYLFVKKKYNRNWKFLFIVLGLIGCYFVFKTGTLGGHLVYDYGIGTKIFLNK